MAAPIITIFDFPVSVSQTYSSIIEGLHLIATIAGKNSDFRSDAGPTFDMQPYRLMELTD